MFKKGLLALLVTVTAYAQGPALVETTPLKKGEVNPLQEFVGTLNFKKNSSLAAQESGIIKRINFEVGDEVKKGQLLVQLDADLLNAQIEAAKANAQSAQRDFERYAKLLESKAIAQKEYDDARVNHISAKNTLKELQIRKDRKAIKAPFSGIIVSKEISLGEWVNVGSLVAQIVNTKDAEFSFNVPLKVANNLKKGDQYEIHVGEQSLKAVMLGVIPNGDKLTRTFPVKFKATTQGGFFFDGQEAKVELSQNGKTQALILPRDAVIKRFGQNVIFAINEQNMAMMIPVQIIGYVEKSVAIASPNLVAGMPVVVKGNERVFPNSPVKVLNK